MQINLYLELNYLSNIPPNSVCLIKTRGYASVGSGVSLFLRKYWYRENREILVKYLNDVFSAADREVESVSSDLQAHGLKLQFEMTLLGLQYLYDVYKRKYHEQEPVVLQIDQKIKQITHLIYKLERGAR